MSDLPQLSAVNKPADRLQKRLFISFSWGDIDVVRVIHDRLTAVPGSYAIWRDEREVERDWSREIASSLVATDAVILVWSQGACNSRWVRRLANRYSRSCCPERLTFLCRCRIGWVSSQPWMVSTRIKSLPDFDVAEDEIL
jgi:hypothetical protein